MQQNQIKKIEGLDMNTKISTLDIAVNKLERLEHLDHLPELRELWINWNYLVDDAENRAYLKKLHLKTIYLADNPISQGDDYQKMLTDAIPSL